MSRSGKHFKGAIVDLDGVILDSLGVWSAIDADYVARHGFPGRPDIVRRLAASPSLMDAARYLRDQVGIAASCEEICREFEDALLTEYQNNLPLIPGAYEALVALKTTGVRMVLATASPDEHAAAALKRLGIIEFFERLFCNADKTSPEIFCQALAALGTTVEETLVIDDNHTILCTAKRLGFATRTSL